jgi:sugar-specific transcriptional regulator TrmB
MIDEPAKATGAAEGPKRVGAQGEGKLLEGMSAFGFSQYEARAYVALLRKSPVNGHELSKGAGVPPSKIYETLGKLRRKGAVLAYESEPTLYAPVPHAELLARLRESTEGNLRELEKGFEGLVPGFDVGLTWSVTGVDNVVGLMERAVDRAKESAFAAVWDAELVELAPALREAHGRGVELQAAVYGTFDLGVPNTYDLALCGESASERLGGRRLSVLVADRREAVVAEFLGGGSAEGIWTENRAMSLLAVEYVKDEIMGRTLIDELGEERYWALRRKRPELVSMLRPEEPDLWQRR